MIRWPDRQEVEASLRDWAQACAKTHPELRQVGYFGSYARGDWGVGSDLDVVVVVSDASAPFAARAAAWDATTMVVPAEVLVYTEAEWQALMERADRFARTLKHETVWVTRG